MQELIKSSGLSIKEFSEEYGIPYNSVRQWYNGERRAPEYIKKLIEENLILKTKGLQLEIEEMMNIPMNEKVKYGWSTINYVVQWNTNEKEYACGLTSLIDLIRLTKKLKKDNIRFRMIKTPIESQEDFKINIDNEKFNKYG